MPPSTIRPESSISSRNVNDRIRSWRSEAGRSGDYRSSASRVPEPSKLLPSVFSPSHAPYRSYSSRESPRSNHPISSRTEIPHGQLVWVEDLRRSSSGRSQCSSFSRNQVLSRSSSGRDPPRSTYSTYSQAQVPDQRIVPYHGPRHSSSGRSQYSPSQSPSHHSHSGRSSALASNSRSSKDAVRFATNEDLRRQVLIRGIEHTRTVLVPVPVAVPVVIHRGLYGNLQHYS
jgi:hypothetical protein